MANNPNMSQPVGFNNQPIYNQPGQVYPSLPGANIPMQNMPPVPPGAAVQWMQRPNPIPGCPIGLEYLTQIDTINVQQIASLVEAFTEWDTNNKYELSNAAGQKIYFAAEQTDTCMRICCGTQRSFTIHIIDNMNQEVIRVTREFKCCAGCYWCAGCCTCCSHELQIEAPPGQVVGFVKQSGSFWKAKFQILDENQNEILKIEGPCFICDGACCPIENEFKVMTLDNNQIGKISKVYSGFIREAFTVADKFTIKFPLDLSAKAKATLIGTLFLIDFMFFERKNNNSSVLIG